MKIFFGFPNSGDITKLSPALQYRKINLLKAAPSQIQLKGLHKIDQPGYNEYINNLPAFLYAYNTNRNIPLSREGYPITTQASDMIHLPVPNITVSYKGSKIPPSILAMTTVQEIPSKDKNTNTYLVTYKAGLATLLLPSGFEKGQFPIGNSISAEDLVATITILRILSAFLRVHKYPAFKNLQDFEMEFADRIELKTREPDDDEQKVIDSGPKKRRIIESAVDEEVTFVEVEHIMDDARIKIHYAKAPLGDELPWGNTSEIPVTDGIVFPFLEELAAWDKDTVCTVLGRYFVRCLGHTTEGSLKGYSDICTAWKRSIHRSSVGNTLSHIFRVIELALPAQARVFPVFENDQYTGCYLSGAGMSIALRGEILRPTSHANNTSDFDLFEGTEAILRRITDLFGTDDKHDAQFAKAKSMKAHLSCRALNNYLKTWITDEQRLEQVRALASKIRYPQEYLRINMDTIQLVITWIKGAAIPIDMPMHPMALGKSSTLELSLSAFGPSAPSPVIPGAPKLQLTPKPPAKFSKPLVFRTTSLENAISDWVEVGKTGFVYNGPTNLSGRYQHVVIRGEGERDRWFSIMNGFHVWSKQQASTDSEVVGNTVDEVDEGGVVLIDRVDISGF
jgi:hypothetical protein